MMDRRTRQTLRRLATGIFTLLLTQPALTQSQQPPTYPALPSETPDTFEPVTDSFDYVRRDVMIPMRDGVKLHTVDPGAEGREARADPADAHALRRERR